MVYVLISMYIRTRGCTVQLTQITKFN